METDSENILSSMNFEIIKKKTFFGKQGANVKPPISDTMKMVIKVPGKNY